MKFSSAAVWRLTAASPATCGLRVRVTGFVAYYSFARSLAGASQDDELRRRSADRKSVV